VWKILKLHPEDVYNLSLTNKHFYNYINFELDYYIKYLPITEYSFTINGYKKWIADPIIKKLKLDLQEIYLFNNSTLSYLKTTIKPISINISGKMVFINNQLQIYESCLVEIKYEDNIYVLKCNFKVISLVKQVLNGKYTLQK